MTPTPDDIRRTRDQLGISRAEFAARINTPLRTLDGWEFHGRQPPGCLAIALKHLAEHAGELPDAD